jgi:hypothetical protein
MGAIVLSSVLGLFELSEARFLFKANFLDFLVWLAAFLGTIFAGVEIGLGIAIGLAILLVVTQSAVPHTAVLGRLPETRAPLSICCSPCVTTSWWLSSATPVEPLRCKHRSPHMCEPPLDSCERMQRSTATSSSTPRPRSTRTSALSASTRPSTLPTSSGSAAASPSTWSAAARTPSWGPAALSSSTCLLSPLWTRLVRFTGVQITVPHFDLPDLSTIGIVKRIAWVRSKDDTL